MSTTLRARLALARYGVIVAALLVIAGLVLFAGGWHIYSNPPTERLTDRTNVQEVSTGIGTSAVVTGNTTLYEPNQRLVNQPVYLLGATPEVTFTLRSSVPSGQSVSIGHRLRLIQSATLNNQPFWESSRTLVVDGATTQEGQLESSATVNMSRVASQLRNARQQIGDIGQFQSRFVLNLSYDTDLYSGSITQEAPITVTERAFWIDGDLSTSRTHSQTDSRTVTRSPNMSMVQGLVGLGLLALISAIGVGYGSRKETDVEELEMQLSVAQFDEWITTGEMPTDPDKKYISTTDIEGLVDIAIDSNKRVIRDTEHDIFTVVDGDIVYYYTPEDVDIRSWFNI